ncbi:17473_t:CDS:1, partial [Dentiscutata erythropus]
MADAINFLFPKIPKLISTVIDHYKNGPPKPSWNLKFHLIFAFIQLAIDDLYHSTIEDVQRFSNKPAAIPPDFAVDQ